MELTIVLLDLVSMPFNKKALDQLITGRKVPVYFEKYDIPNFRGIAGYEYNEELTAFQRRQEISLISKIEGYDGFVIVYSYYETEALLLAELLKQRAINVKLYQV